MNPVLLTTFWEVVIWIAIAFMWGALLWMFIGSFADIFRRRDLSGIGKAGWIVLLIVLPLIGVLAYIMTRPPTAVYVEDMATAASTGQMATAVPSSADEIAKAQQLLSSGAITQEEFDKIKASALA